MAALPRFVLARFIRVAIASIAAFCVDIGQATASLHWNWSYSGTGIIANGTFVTNDTPDGSGFYLIASITGTRNGQAIVALQPTGTPIPGNEPFAVDNLVRLDGPQLTHNGFGFAIAGGTYANPFFADFSTPARYFEFWSAPSSGENSELPISFVATLATIPEPGTAALVLIAFGAFGGFGARSNASARKTCRRTGVEARARMAQFARGRADSN